MTKGKDGKAKYLGNRVQERGVAVVNDVGCVGHSQELLFGFSCTVSLK